VGVRAAGSPVPPMTCPGLPSPAEWMEGFAVPGDVEHYERLAARFEVNWAYSPEFVAWMTGCILTRLDPRPGDRAADIGCGTGLGLTAARVAADPGRHRGTPGGRALTAAMAQAGPGGATAPPADPRPRRRHCATLVAVNHRGAVRGHAGVACHRPPLPQVIVLGPARTSRRIPARTSRAVVRGTDLGCLRRGHRRAAHCAPPSVSAGSLAAG
jgi:hypothetical protein